MSSYKRLTKHPKTGEWHSASWSDDYFGSHNYGVIFPDGEVFDPREVELETKDEVTPMAKLFTEEEMRKEFLAKFKCIQSDCDGFGNIPVQVGDGEWEAKQCQFHAEYLFPMTDYLVSLFSSQLTALVEEIEEKRFGIEYLSRPAELHGLSAKQSYNLGLDTAKSIITKLIQGK